MPSPQTHPCKIAADLDIPINPEIMGAYTYMDMDKLQAPRFEEYPEIYALQNGKDWSELSLDEVCIIMEAYGAQVGAPISAGNEADFILRTVESAPEKQGSPCCFRYHYVRNTISS